ncbi:MAG: hypothetical protein GYB68_18315 [Chloroflexi bacterium]|nr:hypothetical protein [Chloroflexota bacterium]
MTVHKQPEYQLHINHPAPPDYPSKGVQDVFATEPFSQSYAERRTAFLEFWRRNPAPDSNKAWYYELVRLEAGGPAHLGIFYAACDYIDARIDCADFVLHSIIRTLYQYPEHPHIHSAMLDRAKRTALGFKYWPDEPGQDSLCTWTENHQILFNVGAYLVGQLYPDEVFQNAGQTGREKMEQTRPRILRWLNLRFRTGFSEWLSHVYYDEDLTALLSLVDFCADEEIARKAAQVIDLMLLDMALNSFRGVFGSTHGRSYENTKKWAAQEGVTDTLKLLFGMGVFSGFDNMSAACFALSQNYQMPEAIYRIATDLERPEMLNQQRMGIRLDQMERWGLHPDKLEDGMILLSLEAYMHPRSANLMVRMLDAFNWWDNSFFTPFKENQALIRFGRMTGLLRPLVTVLERDVTRNTREEVNITTYRTPDYMLSSAQDYRKRYGGDQQHIWQATLGPNAVVFTTHPARRDGKSPNYWTGSGSLPKAGQVDNVAIIIYDIDTGPGLYVTHRLRFTHAWFPRDQFDEVIEANGWVFGRLGDGYIALHSQQPYHWNEEPGEDAGRELIADGKRNIWLCECGRAAVNGPFADFVAQVSRAEIATSGALRVTYHSPSQGRISMGWDDPLTQNGKPLVQRDYPRYDNPYVQAGFPAKDIVVQAGGASLRLDDRGKRDVG